MDLELLRAQWSATLPPGYHVRIGLPACALCGATHNTHYVARVLMGSCKGKWLNLIDLSRWDST